MAFHFYFQLEAKVWHGKKIWESLMGTIYLISKKRPKAIWIVMMNSNLNFIALLLKYSMSTSQIAQNNAFHFSWQDSWTLPNPYKMKFVRIFHKTFAIKQSLEGMKQFSTPACQVVNWKAMTLLTLKIQKSMELEQNQLILLLRQVLKSEFLIKNI